MPLLEHARAAFAAAFGRPCHGVAVAPGRVNLIGEHTDYNDGFVLPMAVQRGGAAAFSPRGDRIVRAHATAFHETIEISIDTPRQVSGWVAYVAGIAWALDAAHVPVRGVRGVDLAIVGDLPIGA